MDKLALLHPSLGLAFTAEFNPRSDDGTTFIDCNFISDHPVYGFVVGNKATDQLPPGCDGCRVDLAGNEICPCKECDNG